MASQRGGVLWILLGRDLLVINPLPDCTIATRIVVFERQLDEIHTLVAERSAADRVSCLAASIIDVKDVSSATAGLTGLPKNPPCSFLRIRSA